MMYLLIVTIIVVLVIVGIIISNYLKEETSKYTAEAKKVQALMAFLRNEALFYYAGNDESFSGLSVEYFNTYNIEKFKTGNNGNMVACDDTVTTDCWEGLPVNADNVPNPYNGYYISVGGTAGDQIRIIAASLDNGKSAGIYIIKKKPTTVPEKYTQILEKVLAQDPSYFGG